jgi:hypothetical protein
MTDELGRLKVTRKSGQERFRVNGTDAGVDLVTFWQWSASDLVDNTMRGVLAEFIVAKALDLVGDRPRESWAQFDLQTRDGVKVEVKSAAYLQSWAQKRLSRIEFSYRATRGFDADTNKTEDVPLRHADVYVFALLRHKDKGSIDPTNLDQWQFFVAATNAIAQRERSQHSIGLTALTTLCQSGDPMWRGPVGFHELDAALRHVSESANKNIGSRGEGDSECG